MRSKEDMKYEFKPPFKVTDYSWIYDCNGNFCCQLMVNLPDKKLEKLQLIINGKSAHDNKNVYTFYHNEGVIKVNSKNLLLIRGWGFLTGVGGLNLSDKEANEIQNKLGEYITEKLNG